MMHEGRILHTLNAQEKSASQVGDLLDWFSREKGAMSDRTLLA
jgi:ABC-type uncharacterized transport system ATPase component